MNEIVSAARKQRSLTADQRPVFFSRWGNLAHLLSRTMKKEDLLHWKARSYPNFNLPLPVTEYGSAHHLAINYSRAWGFWSLYETSNDSKYLEAYLSHIKQALSLHSDYKDDYRRYGHWVPQFGIYAISISDPRLN